MIIERFPVEASHILMFARAIGDPNPAYVDPDSPEAQALGGVVAPPTFSMAGSQFDPDNVLRPKPGEPWFGSGREPSGAVSEGSGLLHAEQVFEYHQPLRAGMELVATEREGKSWEKESKRGGLLKFSETITDYRDAATGELVVSATLVGVIPERPVDQDA
ncbi:MAG: MaoC family dehydratase N-terminal domain-containing protein [Acidimicrobiia bacterium]